MTQDTNRDVVKSTLCGTFIRTVYLCWKAVGMNSPQIISLVFVFRVEVQAAGGQIWTTTSHTSVTVSRDDIRGVGNPVSQQECNAEFTMRCS